MTQDNRKYFVGIIFFIIGKQPNVLECAKWTELLDRGGLIYVSNDICLRYENFISYKFTVFDRINATALISFKQLPDRRLFETGVY